uniref:RRM domain-containing protein n=1 Tax=Lotharella oceanica TaxID=641309 RepID=A0A7S2TY36_9EUKA
MATKLRVTNVSPLVNSDHLRDLFSSCGEIVSVTDCVKDGDAQTCEVEFKNAEDATNALELSGMELGDRKFDVKLAEAPSGDGKVSGPAEKEGGDSEKKTEKDGEKKDKDKDDDEDDEDSDRRSKKRKKKRDRSRDRRRRDDSRSRSRRRRRRRSRSRDRRRRKGGRRRRRRDDSSDDSSDEELRRRRKRNVNPTPTKFWDGFQWHDISAGQPQGLENRPLASQVNMSQLLAAQREAMASGTLPPGANPAAAAATTMMAQPQQ